MSLTSTLPTTEKEPFTTLSSRSSKESGQSILPSLPPLPSSSFLHPDRIHPHLSLELSLSTSWPCTDLALVISCFTGSSSSEPTEVRLELLALQPNSLSRTSPSLLRSCNRLLDKLRPELTLFLNLRVDFSWKIHSPSDPRRKASHCFDQRSTFGSRRFQVSSCRSHLPWNGMGSQRTSSHLPLFFLSMLKKKPRARASTLRVERTEPSRPVLPFDFRCRAHLF